MAASTMVRDQDSLFSMMDAVSQHIEICEEIPDILNKIEPPLMYTINDLLAERVRLGADGPLFAYPGSVRGVDDYVHYNAKDLDRFADEAAKRYMTLGVPSKDDNGIDEVVAILAPTSLDYVTSLFALSRLGYSLLLLSNRLATEAYVSLLQKTKCHRLFTTPNFTKQVIAIQKEMELQSYQVVDQSSYDLPMPSGPYFTRSFDRLAASKSIALIIHSSGSTGLPKPIFQTHAAALNNYKSGLTYRAFLTLPLYHNHGMSTMMRGLYSGYEVSMINANLPMTGPNLLAAMETLKPGGFHGVPYALKLLSESGRGIELLRACEIVMFGGSSCPDELGDSLVKHGVFLVSHFGTTEVGQLMTSHRARDDLAWNYVRPIKACRPFMQFDLIAPNTYELVVLDGLPSKVATNSDDPPNSFHTSDTWCPHPTINDAWKYIGRLDDRITLVNGEKVLPISMEHQVRTNEYVHECWIFGIGKALPGIMIVPSAKAEGLSTTEIFETIWPSIQAANGHVEGFSQISKEMVTILDIGTEYPSTDKGTMIRAKTYVKFAEQIEDTYIRFENGPVDRAELLTLGIEELENWLANAFSELGVNKLDASTDLFAAGVDSLQAITVFGLIKRELDVGSAIVGQNVVFEYPSVSNLAQHLFSLRTGEDISVKDELTLMADLIEKYSTFATHQPSTSEPEKETILLTGATGSLGAHVLSQLITQDNVDSVYCLVRASSASAATERVLATLWSKLIPPVYTRKVVYLPADLSREDLGLDSLVISTLKTKLTKVLHCAWAVNFNLGVSSFEQQHIRGTHNLLNLCLSVSTPKPASLFFCSSISAAAGTPLPANIGETFIPDLSHAQSMGYARSKLVTENIIKAAASKTGMRGRVLRVGQIVGDSATGLWNSTEAIPLMIRSATTIGALPELDETPSWMPSDLVAKAILELSGVIPSVSSSFASITEDDNVVYHVQNSHLFHWTNDLLPALRSSGLEFRNVSQREWVQLLRESDIDPVKNPTIKLLDFFAEKYDNEKAGRKALVFATEKSGIVSKTVASGYDVVYSGLVGKMVQKWKMEWAV